MAKAKKSIRVKKYILVYVKNCEPKIEEFILLDHALRVINALPKNEDNWVDALIEGRRLKLKQAVES